MRTVVSLLIGLFTAIIGLPVYNFSTKQFSLLNCFILAILVLVWLYVYDTFIKPKNKSDE
jgi:hypothetical protein